MPFVVFTGFSCRGTALCRKGEKGKKEGELKIKNKK
jgi:hypothetical protein